MVQTCLPSRMAVHYRAQNALAAQLYIKQEWEIISLSKLQQLMYSVPKHLLSAVKGTGDVTQW